MNVLIINGSADLYGANRVLLEVIKILGNRKIVLFVPDTGPLTDLIKKDSVYSNVVVKVFADMPVVARRMGSVKGIANVLRRLKSFRKAVSTAVREYNISWAYVNTLSCFLAARSIRPLRLKILLHVHEILENSRPLTRLINKYSLSWVDKVITVSDPVKNNLVAVAKTKDISKMVTVLNGIPDRYSPQAENTRSGMSDIVVTLFGRIKPEKGIWFFLDAIASLPASCIKKCKFQIFGDTPPGKAYLLNRLENDIACHPAREAIRFQTFIPDITNALNTSDIIVVPSLMRDPFPTTVLEGLSAGKPVIATNTGGAVQSVKDNVTGFLISPEDKAMFSQKLETLIMSDSLRIEMGNEARNEFLKRFTLATFRLNLMEQINRFEQGIKQHKNEDY